MALSTSAPYSLCLNKTKQFAKAGGDLANADYADYAMTMLTMLEQWGREVW